MVKAGLKAIYLSGWQVAADANSAFQTYPDQSLYPVDSVPKVVKRINNALRRADQIEYAEGKVSGRCSLYTSLLCVCTFFPAFLCPACTTLGYAEGRVGASSPCSFLGAPARFVGICPPPCLSLAPTCVLRHSIKHPHPHCSSRHTRCCTLLRAHPSLPPDPLAPFPLPAAQVTRDYLVPIVADAEAGFGGPLNAYELTYHLIEAGAAAGERARRFRPLPSYLLLACSYPRLPLHPSACLPISACLCLPSCIRLGYRRCGLARASAARSFKSLPAPSPPRLNCL